MEIVFLSPFPADCWPRLAGGTLHFYCWTFRRIYWNPNIWLFINPLILYDIYLSGPGLFQTALTKLSFPAWHELLRKESHKLVQGWIIRGALWCWTWEVCRWISQRCSWKIKRWTATVLALVQSVHCRNRDYMWFECYIFCDIKYW